MVKEKSSRHGTTSAIIQTTTKMYVTQMPEMDTSTKHGATLAYRQVCQALTPTIGTCLLLPIVAISNADFATFSQQREEPVATAITAEQVV